MIQRSCLGGVVLILILTTGAAMADLFGKSTLSPEWVERFQDLSKLNAYAANQPVHLSNVILTGWDISGAKLPGARFEDTEWKDVKLERGVLSNVTFKKSKLQGVGFQQTTLTDVTFEDTELRSTSFYKAKLQRVRFVRCKFNGVNVDEVVESTIEIIDSKILSSSLNEGQLVATIKGSTLKDVSISDLESPSSLTFENSELKDIEFSRSTLERLVMIGVTAKKGGFEGGRIGRLEISDSSFGLSFREMEIDHAIYQRNVMHSRYNRSRIRQMTVTACKEVSDFGFFEAKVEALHINGCSLSKFDLADATINDLNISNGSIVLSDFSGMKVKSALLENVVLDKELDFTNAHIDQLTTKNVTKLPTLNLITTGSNVKFD